MKPAIKIFSDFDGTISLEDIGDQLFIKFGEIEPFHQMFVNGEINIHQYWRSVCNTIPYSVLDTEIIEWTKSQEIDYYFPKFYSWCKENGFPITIVSDGFDIYVKNILTNNDLDITYYCNELKKDKKYIPVFPNASDSCNCLSASCKRNIILNNTKDEEIIVYIGDGRSDFCCAEHADIIFAKKLLAKYCNENKIPHYPYKSFFDVQKRLSELIKKHKFKQRNVAKVKRKKAFETE